MIVARCRLHQPNVEDHELEIDNRHGTRLAMPVTYCSQLMTVDYGGTTAEDPNHESVAGGVVSVPAEADGTEHRP